MIKRIFYTAIALTVSTSPTVAFEGDKNWHIENCKLTATGGNATISTDGYLSGDDLMFRLKFDVPVKPDINIYFPSLDDWSPTIDGTQKTFSFEFKYNGRNTAALLKKENAIVVSYTPYGTNKMYRTLFPTQNIPEDLLKLRAKCGNHRPHTYTDREWFR